MQIPLVDLKAQLAAIRGQVLEAMTGVIDSTAFILGPEVESFEREFAAYCEASYAVGVGSGLSALVLALRAAGVGPGHEVIAPANTFIATISAIVQLGAWPVLVDMNPTNYNLDLAAVEAAVRARTKAVIPVHLYGQPVDMDPLLDLARNKGLVVVEDAAQAHGARYRGRRVGSMGHLAAFSFYPGKNLGAYGDGGAVVTSDPELAEAVRRMRNYGQSRKYHHDNFGDNSRLDSVQAAVLRIKLAHLDRWNQARRKNAAYYRQVLQDTELELPVEQDFAEHVYHLYVVRTPRRDELLDYLHRRGIGAGIHYPIPCHLQKSLAFLGHGPGDFPHSEKAAAEILSLPMFPELTTGQMDYVAQAVKDFFAGRPA